MTHETELLVMAARLTEGYIPDYVDFHTEWLPAQLLDWMIAQDGSEISMKLVKIDDLSIGNISKESLKGYLLSNHVAVMVVVKTGKGVVVPQKTALGALGLVSLARSVEGL